LPDISKSTPFATFVRRKPSPAVSMRTGEQGKPGSHPPEQLQVSASKPPKRLHWLIKADVALQLQQPEPLFVIVDGQPDAG
jgi:hypothetical protein